MCAVLEGDPVLGMALEYMTPEFEMEPLFEELGEHFMINLGPAGGLNLATRNAQEVNLLPYLGVHVLVFY